MKPRVCVGDVGRGDPSAWNPHPGDHAYACPDSDASVLCPRSVVGRSRSHRVCDPLARLRVWAADYRDSRGTPLARVGDGACDDARGELLAAWEEGSGSRVPDEILPDYYYAFLFKLAAMLTRIPQYKKSANKVVQIPHLLRMVALISSDYHFNYHMVTSHESSAIPPPQ